MTEAGAPGPPGAPENFRLKRIKVKEAMRHDRFEEHGNRRLAEEFLKCRCKWCKELVFQGKLVRTHDFSIRLVSACTCARAGTAEVCAAKSQTAQLAMR